MEQEYELKPVGVRYICDKCGEGVMVVKGNIMLTVDPPLFPHECSYCGATRNFVEKYPTVRFRAP